MANEKILNTRIQLLGDFESEWDRVNPILKANEAAISWALKENETVDANTGYGAFIGIKYGDGKKSWRMLDYSDKGAKDAIATLRGDVDDIIGDLAINYVDDAAAEVPTAHTVDVVANLGAEGMTLTEELVTVATEAGVDAAIEEVNVFDPEGAVITKTLGGIAANTDLTGQTTHQILKALLYPYEKPAIGTVSTNAAGGTFERGTTKTVTTVTVNFTKKSKPVTKVTVYKGSTNIGTIEGANLTSPQTFTVPTEHQGTSSGTQFKATVTDEQGGVSNTGSATGFTYVYPYYYGVCAANDTINETLVEGLTKKVESKGTKTWSFTGDSQKMVIAYPKAHNTLKKVTDTGNGADSTGAFGSPITVSITGLDGSAQDYYVYASAPVGGTFTMKFEHN